MRSTLKFGIALSPALLMAVWMMILFLREAADLRQVQRRNAIQMAAVKPSYLIFVKIQFCLERNCERFGNSGVRNLTDCLELNYITTNEFQFLTNHGARIHAISWNTIPSNQVVMELFDGNYLIAKNGKAAFKRDWGRF